jgi:nucleoid-associated protein YgaU
MRMLLLWMVLLTLPVAAVCWHWQVLEGSVAKTTPPPATAQDQDQLVLLIGGQAASLRGAQLLVGEARPPAVEPEPRVARNDQAPPPAKDPPAKDPPAKNPPAKEPPKKDPPLKDPTEKRPLANAPVKPAKDPARSTVVGDGENLYRIAHRELGDGARWREIAKLNHIADGSVARIKTGARLELPRR